MKRPSEPNFASVATLLADSSRAAMLSALMSGRAHTAKELACVAEISAATASEHLAKLVDRRLLVVTAQGRHRYFHLASASIARLLESLMAVAADDTRSIGNSPRVDARMRQARTCYDHVAGRVGVALAEALVRSGHIILADGSGEVTASGREFLSRTIGLPGPELLSRSRRPLCRPCLDWSERRFHLAGALGAALHRHCIEHGWLRRLPHTRALAVTSVGRRALEAQFGVTFPDTKGESQIRAGSADLR